jgi:hypothetical protein
VVLFLRLSTQWKIIAAGMGSLVFTGIDYAAAGATMGMLRVKNRQSAFDDLQVMEFAALEILNKSGDPPPAT